MSADTDPDTITASCTVRMHLRKTAIYAGTDSAIDQMKEKVRRLLEPVAEEVTKDGIEFEASVDYLIAFPSVKGDGNV